MGGSNEKSSPKFIDNPNGQRNIDVPHNQRPAGAHEAQNKPSYEFDGAHNKSPVREGEDHGGHGRRTPQGQRLAEHAARDNEAKNSPVYRGGATRFAGRDHGPEKSPVDRGQAARLAGRDHRPDESPVHHGEAARFAGHDHRPDESPVHRDEHRRAHEKDDESGKIAQYHGRLANQRGGSAEQDEKFEQPAARNQARVVNGRRFSKDDEQLIQRRRFQADAGVADEDVFNAFANGPNSVEKILKGVPLEEIMNKCKQLPPTEATVDVPDAMTAVQPGPVVYALTQIQAKDAYVDRWDDLHVQMPCSSMYIASDRKPMWPAICDAFRALKKKCERGTSTFDDLKEIIQTYGECRNDMAQLEKLINKVYKGPERSAFLHQTLPKMCDLVLNLRSMFKGPPLLLRIGLNQAVTLSQEQAASLLACAFFCLFPYRSEHSQKRAFQRFPQSNFDRLYQGDSAEKIEKIKCLLHYFGRVTNTMPYGLITFKRFQLSQNRFPQWNKSRKPLCHMHLRTTDKIEDIEKVLQADFANKYIGGGVLGNGCVQEEIRFTICPEMIVSLLLCEVMETNECIFLIGCERYSTYTGYANSFEFAGNFDDKTARDPLGHRYCHVVAMDAIFFREKTKQYEMANVDRELLKAYTSFYPQVERSEYHYPIATGNWGCGAFNGDKELKAIIQLMAASETERPLIYASFGDKSLVESFSEVYDYLRKGRATVGNLYQYLHQYSKLYHRMTLFQYIQKTPVSSLRS